MNILTIPLDQIEVGERLRSIDADYAALLAASMAEQGQMTPIEVRPTPKAGKPYALVAGGHRLAALRIAGIDAAQATVFEGGPLEAKLREIDENLARRELTQLDRSTFLAERKAVYEALHPETKQGAKGRGDRVANFATFERFSAITAQRLGLSERLIQLAVQRHEQLHPDVRQHIAGTWLADHGAQLDALAKLAPSDQLRVVRIMFDNDEPDNAPRSIGAAVAAINGVPAATPLSPEEAMVQAFARLWKRAPAPVRRRIRALISKAGEA